MTRSEALWQDHLQRLGDFIKTHRAMNQLSQRELARLADLSDSYMSQLERGRHEPSISVLRALAAHLGIRPNELILYAAGLPVADEAATSEEVIGSDPRLTPAQRTRLLDLLQSYVQENSESA